MLAKYLSSFFALLCVSFLTSFSFAQTGDADKKGSDALGFIDISFCDKDDKDFSTGHLMLEVEQGKEADICILISNKSNVSASVKLHLVDGTITVDETQKRSCKSNAYTERFGKYVKGYDKLITVGSKSSVEQHAILALPPSHVGKFLGCVAYEIFQKKVEGEKESAGMFDIVLRKAKFIDVFVDGEITVGLEMVAAEEFDAERNLLKDDLYYLYETPEGELAFVAGVKNIGHADQTISATLIAHDMRGRELINEKIERTIIAGESSKVSYVIKNIPWYKGRLTFDFRLEHQASFSFESDSITEEMRQKHEILFVQKIMIFPWILIVILGVVLIVLQTIHYIWKKKRSHQEDNAINQNAMFQGAYGTNNDAFLYNTNTGQGYAYPYDQSIDPYAQQNLGQQDYNQQNYNQQAYYDPSQGQNYPPPGYPQGQNYSQPNYNQQAYYDPSQGQNYPPLGYPQGQNYPPPGYPQGQNYSQPNYNQQQCCPTHLAKEGIRGMTR